VVFFIGLLFFREVVKYFVRGSTLDEPPLVNVVSWFWIFGLQGNGIALRWPKLRLGLECETFFFCPSFAPVGLHKTAF